MTFVEFQITMSRLQQYRTTNGPEERTLNRRKVVHLEVDCAIARTI